MNNTPYEKILRAINGMAQSEAVVNEDTPNSKIALEVAASLIKCEDQKSFSKSVQEKDIHIPVAAIPVGLCFWQNLPQVIDWGRADNFLVENTDKSAGVATAIMVCCAMTDVPMGVWCNEVSTVLSGIDNSLVNLLNEAIVLSMDGGSPEEASSILVSKGVPMAYVVAASLYCCLVAGQQGKEGSFKRVSEIAKQCSFYPDAIAALAGCLTAILDPEATEDNKYEDVAINLIGAHA